MPRKRPECGNPGEKNGNAILTAEQVREIREEAASQIPFTWIAHKFGVHPTTIGKIVRRQRWRTV